MAVLEEIKRLTLLAAKNVLTFNDVAELTGLSRSYLYKLTYSKKIPHYKQNGKLLYFDRGEVEAWMKQNRVNTQEEAEQAAIRYTVAHDMGERVRG